MIIIITKYFLNAVTKMKKLTHQFNQTVGWGAILGAGLALASLMMTGVPWEPLLSGFTEQQLWLGTVFGTAVGVGTLSSHDKEHGGFFDTTVGKLVVFVGIGIVAGGLIDFAFFHDHPMGQALYASMKDMIMPVLDVVANLTGNSELTYASLGNNLPTAATNTAAATSTASAAVTTSSAGAQTCTESLNTMTGLVEKVCG